MSRRHEEFAFGSDSFLDVVANAVGILVILIVLTGLRVSRTPAKLPTPVAAIAAPQVASEPPPPVEPPASAPEVLHDDAVLPPPLPPQPRIIVVEKPLPAQPDPAPPAALVEQANALGTAVAELESIRNQLAEDAASLKARVAAAQATLDSAAQSSAETVARQSRERTELSAGRRELTETREQLAELKGLLAEAGDAPAAAATTIQHRVTPIGRVVSGQELHFLLTKGRVAYVPVESLARRLTSQIERQRATLAKMERYEGSIEPLDGFGMRYVIQRQPLTLAEELKYGRSFVRMQVTQWTLLPEPNLVSETPEEALRRDSLFYQAMLSAGPTATLTFWVYPDSFAACSKLKEFAHRHGYEVAARPLPFGVPITGSPDGSKSIAQ